MSTAEPSNAQPSRRPPWWVVLILVVLVALALFGDKGVLRALQANREKLELEAQVKTLETSNAELRREIEALRNDRRTIENLARKELGMVRDGELVYQFRSRPKPVPAPPSSSSADPSGE